MASPGNRHCANCIGTHSFPIVSDSAPSHVLYSGVSVWGTFIVSSIFGNYVQTWRNPQTEITSRNATRGGRSHNEKSFKLRWSSNEWLQKYALGQTRRIGTYTHTVIAVFRSAIGAKCKQNVTKCSHAPMMRKIGYCSTIETHKLKQHLVDCYVLRNCLTLNYISFSYSYYLPSRTVVLAIVFTV